MTTAGPLLEALTRRLAECPAEFLMPPRTSHTSLLCIDVAAIICDQLRAMGADVPLDAAKLFQASLSPVRINALQVLALAAWLLHDDWFLAHRELANLMPELFIKGFDELAALVKAKDFVNDADRREEFVRLCLSQLRLHPQEETALQAADRLKSLDSVERVRVVRGMRDAEMRARKIREQMARKAAEAAAARYSPE